MNPQYGGSMGAQGPFVPPYAQTSQPNTYNGFEMHGVSGTIHQSAIPGKGYSPIPYGNAAVPNGPSAGFPNNTGLISNQSTSQVQSALVPPINELSNEMNSMQLSHSQNHPLLLSGASAQRLPSSGGDQCLPPPASSISSNQAFQQPFHQPPPNQFVGRPPGSSGQFSGTHTSMPLSTGIANYRPSQSPEPFYSAPPQNSAYPRQYGDRPVPPLDPRSTMPQTRMQTPEGFQAPQQQQGSQQPGQQQAYQQGGQQQAHQQGAQQQAHQQGAQQQAHQQGAQQQAHQHGTLQQVRQQGPQQLDHLQGVQQQAHMHGVQQQAHIHGVQQQSYLQGTQQAYQLGAQQVHLGAQQQQTQQQGVHQQQAQHQPAQQLEAQHQQAQQQQFNSGQPLAYGNNANGPLPPLPNSQYGPPTGMQARYPPSSQPPNGMQGNVLPPASQYPQPNAAASQNRMGSLPQPAVQNRRLDPDNMPSPIQVIEDDRKLRSNSFVTNQRGQVPPLVTTNFTVFDEGICSPRFIRSTVYNVPTTAEMLKQTSVPFAIAISPFARQQEKETPPAIADPGDQGPVRCNRCKAYICPFMQFIDAGRRFQCVFCKATSEVPPEYFAHLDHMGERVDKFSRPELCLGSYEFIANKDYCKNGKFPNSPAFIFLIDVSYNSIRSGMVKLLCDNMKNVLSELPREGDETQSKIRVGFITYSTVVHFYNISGNLAQPQMLVVSDVQDMFMPLLEGFLVHVNEAEHVIQSLMEQIPVMFADSKETETILGPAIQAGLEALKAADCAGKLFVFHSTLPIAESPGKLRNRDDRKLLGTEKEKTILCPQNTFYNNLGQECVSAGCCVDLFLFPNAYIDVATLGQVCRLTGGQLYKYTYFQSDIDGERFVEDLRRDVGKLIAFDAVLRVRTSTGIRPTDFTGNFFMSNTTDVELGAVDCDKSITVEIKYDDKLGEEDGVCIQTAVLFTSCGGQRRLRIHNLALNTCSQMAELFRSCELDTMMNVFLKEGIRMIVELTPRQVKDHFITRSAQILACYRKNCAQVSSAGQLILPECMKLLPLYINCLIKSDAIAGGQEMSTDDRSFIMMAAYSMDIDSSAAYLYPRLLPIHDINPQSDALPIALRCSIERIKENNIYLLENGICMFLWLGMNANTEWIQDVFGVQTVARIDVDKTHLLQLNTELSKRVRIIVDTVQNERQRYMKLHLVRQGDKVELLFRQLLVEDRTTEGSASYVDFLCHLHKEIRTLLS